MGLPELVIFDLGNVIVHVDILSVAGRLGRTSVDPRYHDPAYLLSAVRREQAALLAGFDTGRVSPRQFHEALVSSYGLRVDYGQFVEIWNSGFSEDTAVASMVLQLTRRYRVYLLSNTNPLHFKYLRDTCPVLESMEERIVSYEAGCAKPDAAIYRRALDRSGVPPEMVWYVDDIPEFVRAAGEQGIHAIQFRSPAQLRVELEPILNGS